jgi:hypothetical protein
LKPDFAHLTPDTADRLTRKQAETLLLLHLTQPTLARGIPASVFKALRNKAKPDPVISADVHHYAKSLRSVTRGAIPEFLTLRIAASGH